jgi:hypothetical protein
VKRKKFSEAHLLLEAHLAELGLLFKPEFKFCESRDWRADYGLYHVPESVFLLVEIEGAVWKQGRHTRGSGYVRDLEKYRMASALGFKLFRFTTEEVLNGTAKDFLEKWT